MSTPTLVLWPRLSFFMLHCTCREVASAAKRAVEDAALVADAARADEIAAKRELQDLRQQLTEQLSEASRVTSSQDATIRDLYSQLEVQSMPCAVESCPNAQTCARKMHLVAMHIHQIGLSRHLPDV